MSNSITQIPVKGNIDCIALQKVCDDLLSAHKVVLRASEGYSNHTTSTPLLDMDELRVRYWLRGQDGFVTSREVAMAKYLKAAGWRPVKKVQGTQYWARGASAERVS